jgi:uncharacterized protein YbjT (DUF2867 family)
LTRKQLIGEENVPVELSQALTAYGLAKKAGLKHVTYVSVYTGDQFLEVPHFANKCAVEEAIRVGGMPIRFCGQRTSLRMSAGSSLR